LGDVGTSFREHPKNLNPNSSKNPQASGEIQQHRSKNPRFQVLSVAFPLLPLLCGTPSQAMGDMTAVMGNRQAALDVAKQAMQRVARSPYVSAVPGGYPETWQRRMGRCRAEMVGDVGGLLLRTITNICYHLVMSTVCY
jgi:hypothetical protein